MLRLAAALLFALSSPALARAPDHGAWERILRAHVHDGHVDYAALRADPKPLRAAVETLEQVDPSQLEPDEALAYWINLYNAATIRLLVENEAVESIRDLGGPEGSPWKRRSIQLGERVLSLDQIEHEILRPRFADPRVHFALNCAARSCPPLQRFAYVGERINEQLDAVTRAALADPRVLDLAGCGEDGGVIRLNRIFEWYAEDFGDLREFLRAQLDPQPQSRWLSGCEIEFMPYDWSLND